MLLEKSRNLCCLESGIILLHPVLCGELWSYWEKVGFVPVNVSGWTWLEHDGGVPGESAEHRDAASRASEPSRGTSLADRTSRNDAISSRKSA